VPTWLSEAESPKILHIVSTTSILQCAANGRGREFGDPRRRLAQLTANEMNAERTTYRVIKTLAPGDRGTVALAQKYGQALVCVRHRTDDKGTVRYTTVELVVHSAPIRPRSTRIVFVRTEPHEQALQSMIKAAGGRWDGKNRLWRLPSRVVGILNLRDRVVGMLAYVNPHVSPCG
jgi:hypothetical protein